MAALRLGFRTNNFWVGFMILLLVGGVFVWVGSLFLSSNLDLIKNGITTKATVLEIVKHTSSKSTTYYPVMEYLTSDGELIKTQSSSGASRNAYKAGDVVNIIYTPSNPTNFLFDKFFDKYGFPSIFILAGAICLIINVFQVARKINRWRLSH